VNENSPEVDLPTINPEFMTPESGRALIDEANRWQAAYCRERDLNAELVGALEEIASPDKLVDANEDAFSVHAFRRAQNVANWAISRAKALQLP
jgi:hypothetical protein